MTAIQFTDAQEERALEVAREIGAAIRQAREARGETMEQAAVDLDTWQYTVGRIERGESPNPKLGSLVKLLDRYDLALIVVPKTQINSHSAAGGAER